MLDIPPPLLNVETLEEITTEESKKAIASIKNRIAIGIDVITAEVLKDGGEPMVAMLHKIFIPVYATNKTPKSSLLSISCKVCSRHLLSRMQKK